MEPLSRCGLQGTGNFDKYAHDSTHSLIDICSPVAKLCHQVQVVGVSFLDMATCEVCRDGFANDAEKHLCSQSRDSCCHVCHADCLQQYRLKQGCPMHDCPFCFQNEDCQEEADDDTLHEMEIEAAMQEETMAEGAKRKDREEEDSPVHAGKKFAVTATPPGAENSPVPPTQRSRSPESPPLTQGGSEAARLSIPSFGIDIYDLSRTSKASTTVKDPMHDAMSEYLACCDEAKSLELLHNKSTYQGLGSPEASYQTVLKWLNAALKDPRDHHSVASDFAFSTREMLPVPFEVSLRTIARKEGWEPETFMAPILSNIGWMEHPGTRLRLQPDEEHRRGCVVQIVCAGDPSMRKSSLKDFTSKKLLSHADVPAVIKAGGATCTDATIKGIRASIKEYGRAGIISDEIATTYAVTSGRETRHSGLHYGNKEKMCTWLNCEDDKTVTGDGATALTHYTFVHQVYGQVSLCEYVLQPTASMFSKRIHATWQTRPVTSDPDQQSQSSKEFLIDFFGWMGRVASNQEKDHYFDKFALPVLRKALQAISDFLQENHGNIEEPIQQKLRYADTDVARYANAAMRCRQYAEARRALALARTMDEPAVEMTIFDLGHALHIWRRQMCLWFAFYRSKQVEALVGPKAVPEVQTPGLADLDAKMKLQRIILSNPRCAGPTSTAHIRQFLKYHFQKEREERPAKYILAAVRDLLNVGIVEEQAPKLKDKKSAKSKEAAPKSEPRGPPGGHAVLYYKKCAWEDLLTNSEAQDMIAKLQLSANNFQ